MKGTSAVDLFAKPLEDERLVAAQLGETRGLARALAATDARVGKLEVGMERALSVLEKLEQSLLRIEGAPRSDVACGWLYTAPSQSSSQPGPSRPTPPRPRAGSPTRQPAGTPTRRPAATKSMPPPPPLSLPDSELTVPQDGLGSAAPLQDGLGSTTPPQDGLGSTAAPAPSPAAEGESLASRRAMRSLEAAGKREKLRMGRADRAAA
jgi:hypothetical protein